MHLKKMEFSNPSRPFPCTLCKRAFKSKQFLQRHMTSHSDAREFSCQFCEKSYKYKKGLNRHVKKVHSLCDFSKNKSLRKSFKVEDFLDLQEKDKYVPKKLFDPATGKEIEILFTWRHRGVVLD